MDLTINGVADRIGIAEYISSWLYKYGNQSIGAIITGKAVAFRIYVKPLDMEGEFERVPDENLSKCFEAIEKLTDLADLLDAVQQIMDTRDKKTA